MSDKVSDKNRRSKSADWWKTPKTEAFLEAEEAVEAALVELTSIECEMQKRITQQVARRECHNTMIQSLNCMLIQCLLRREMVTSPEWQRAWQRFTEAVLKAREASQEFRQEIQEVADKT